MEANIMNPDLFCLQYRLSKNKSRREKTKGVTGEKMVNLKFT